ncbi:unnamed protein product [Blepharisma stoltei]|uniref:Protein phosphatase n=1 Tax=Blepharisma stoltei TaxID=1481888 RepID=A0AAU9IYP4_9CILI|nr:unnamed protein product [Blepharisma stoltei]
MIIAQNSIAQYLNNCQIKIKNAFKYYQARQNRLKGKQLVRIFISKNDTLEPIFLIGNFTNPPWRVKLPLAYSLSYKEYFIELWLSIGNQFRLLRKGTSFAIPNFPQIAENILNMEKGSISNIILFRNTSLRKPLPYHHTDNLVLKTGAYSEGKSHLKNEDAYFTTAHCIGVADGVGGWNQYGVSSKDFANEFMQNCKKFAEKSKFLQIKKCAEEAFKNINSGGSAAWILANLEKNKLKISNLGDCGIMTIRKVNGNPRIIFQSSPQEHFFNTPYQISRELSLTQIQQLKEKLSNEKYIEVMEQMKNIIKDSLWDSDDYCLKVKAGDLIIMASDGLWDNVFPKEILAFLSKYKEGNYNPIELANLLGRYAYFKSKSKLFSPFEERVKKNYGNGWTGGKPDDVTVVVASVA